MKIRDQARRCAALLLAVMILPSCGKGSADAVSMRLMRTEGEVGVSDDAGKNITPKENLKLYSGYGVNTQPASFAWINLDDVKLSKLDEKSEIAIQKEDKHLEIEIKSGALFFDVARPLEADERMDIRTSSMVIGIRGTCGWVDVPRAGYMDVYLLEGKVTCTAGETATVTAGEVGRLDETTGTITVEPFAREAVPDFVRGELDSVLLDSIPKTLEIPSDSISGAASDPTSETPTEQTSEMVPAEDALAQYRMIVGQASAYEYGANDPTGVYRYALVRMRADNDVPALLLEQDTVFGISNVLVFQYEADSKQVIQPDGALSEGVAQAGGYRGSLLAAGDGNGLLSTEFYSGSGMGSTSRVTLNGNTLQSAMLWEGNVFTDTDPTDEEIGYLEISWHDITDLSGLESWAPSAAVPSQTLQSAPDDPEADKGSLPADGDRIVFRGTLGVYSYSEVLALQGQPDPNPGSDMGETYCLIILDTPQTMNLRSGGGLNSYEGEVHLVDVSSAAGISQYVGQNLIFSIDPNETRWPSDTSLPLGEPRSSDVHVLN